MASALYRLAAIPFRPCLEDRIEIDDPLDPLQVVSRFFSILRVMEWRSEIESGLPTGEKPWRT
jgi:hypothetical protein